ncbi:hypothetical protein BGZ63DRAFT_47154 [Mariannaea sp. PMI_226]|nr:hypothetical protein BGZ63DRAFT_47154 [Mariannaea sp. PMI_226]
MHTEGMGTYLTRGHAEEAPSAGTPSFTFLSRQQGSLFSSLHTPRRKVPLQRELAAGSQGSSCSPKPWILSAFASRHNYLFKGVDILAVESSSRRLLALISVQRSLTRYWSKQAFTLDSTGTSLTLNMRTKHGDIEVFHLLRQASSSKASCSLTNSKK